MQGSRRFDRIHVSSGCLVVPPFGCAWLTDTETQFADERGCVVFEVKGETDATVILKSRPGSRRWQHLRKKMEGEELREDSYLVIFGSHRNTLLTIERNGEAKVSFRTDWSHISPNYFRKFWICYGAGVLYVGTEDPSQNYGVKWEDPKPLNGIQYIGLSAWDKHCTFRNIRVQSCIPWLQAQHGTPPSLFDILVSNLLDILDLPTACWLLLALDRLDIPNMELLQKKASLLLAMNFEDFMKKYPDVFSVLSSKAVCSLLRSPELSVDETFIFNSVVSWIFQGDPKQNIKQIRSSEEIRQVIKWVRFTIIDPPELKVFLLDDSSHFFVLLNKMILTSRVAKECLEVSKAIRNALIVQNHASDSAVDLMLDGPINGNREFSQSKMDIDFYWKRALPNAVQLQYAFDGDKNGVSSYLGSNGGTRPWQNSMVTKKLTIKASSPSNRFTNPKEVVGHRFLRTNFAGPKRVNNTLVTWWMIDLQDRLLVCNYYTIRHDASYDFPRYWDFQGSDDNESWTSLKRHEDDRTINAPACFGSWPIYCNARPYRMFRLLLTRPTESLTAPHNLCLSNLELYGALIEAAPA